MARIVRVKVRLDLNEAKAQARELGRVLRSELNNAIKGTKSDEFDVLKRKIDAVRASANRLRKTEEQLARTSKRLEDAKEKLARANEKAAKAQSFLSKETLTSVARFKVANAVLGVLPQALELVRQAYLDTLQAAIEFESGLVSVAKTTDGILDSNNELTESGKAIRQEFLNLSRDIPIAISEILQIGEIAGQLGVAREDLTQFTEVVGRLSRTTNLTVEQAATNFSKLANVLGLNTDQVEQLASAVVFLGNNYATTERDILSFSQRIAGAAAVVDLSAAAVAGISTAFLAVGVTPQSAATAVQKSLLAIETAVVSGSDALDTFASTAGLSATEFAEVWERDAGEAFVRFIEGLGRQGGEAINTLTELGIADQRLVRAFLALASAGDLARESVADATAAYAENTALTEEAEKQFSTTEASLQRLSNAWNELQITFSNTSGIQSAIDSFTEYINATADSEAILQSTISAIERLNQLEGFRGGGSRIDPSAARSPFVAADVEAQFAADTVTEESLRVITARLDAANESLDQFSANAIVANAASILYGSGIEATNGRVQGFSEVLAAQAVQFSETGEITALSLQRAIENLTFEAEAVERSAETKALAAETNLSFAQSEEDFSVAAQNTSATLEQQIAIAELTQQVFADVQKTILDTAAGFVEADDIVAQSTLSFIEQAQAAGLTHDALLTLIGTSGVLTEEQQKQLEVQYELAQLEGELRIAVEEGNITNEAAIAQIQAKAAELQAYQRQAERTVDTEAQLAESQQELADTATEVISSFIETEDVTGQLTKRLIEAAAQSGATAEEILLLAESSGLLSKEEQEAAKNAVLLAQKQQELQAAVDAQILTFAEAAVALQSYAASLGIAAEQATKLTEVSSDYAGALGEVVSASGGASGAAAETQQSFRDLFVEVVKGTGDLEELDNSSEAWMDTLFDMSIAAGASIEQILGLGIATGKLDESLAKTLLNMAVAQRGVEQIAEEYVSGQISAEMASEAVGELAAQIEAGADIDLSRFGISAADLTAKADSVASSAGGAASAIETWRDKLTELASAEGLSAAAFSQLAASTGNYTDEQIRAGLVQDTINRSLQEYAELISQGLDPQQAVSDISALESALNDLSLIDLTTFLDGVTDLGVDLDTSQILQVLDNFKLTGEIEVPVVTKVDRAALDELASAKIEVQAEIALAEGGGTQEGAGFVPESETVQIKGDTSDMSQSIRDVVEADQITTVDGDVSPLEESIHGVTTDASYETDVDADIQTGDIQAQLDAGSYSIDVSVNLDDFTGPGGGSGGGSGGATPPEFARGGLVFGRSHQQGGELVNLEGGEFVVGKDAISPLTLKILRKINEFGTAALPDVATDLLNSIGDTTIPADVGSILNGIASTRIPGDSLFDPVGETLTNSVGPVPTNNTSTTNINQSRQESTTVNNYYSGGRLSNRGTTDVFGASGAGGFV